MRLATYTQELRRGSRFCTLLLFINPRRACAARVTVLGSVCVCVCLCVCLTYGASVRPENAVTYSAGNEGQKICGVFSENAPLLRSSGVAVVFHTFRWPFFFITKAVRMRIGIHSYACRTVGEYPASPTIVDNIQPCPKRCR